MTSTRNAERIRVGIVNQPWNPIELPVEQGSIAIWHYEVARRMGGSCDTVSYCKALPQCPPSQIDEGVDYRRADVSPDPWSWSIRMRWALKRVRGCRWPLFADPLYFGGYGERVARALVQADCDIIHLPNLTQFAPVLRAHNPRAKILLHMHCEWLNQLPADLMRERLNTVDMVAGCSAYITDKAREALPVSVPFRTLYNGVDTDAFAPAALNHSDRAGRDPILLFVGRVTPEKGLHTLIDAFARIAGSWPGARLFIVGPGSVTPPEFLVERSDDTALQALGRFYGREAYPAMLQRQAAEAGLAGRVEFVGKIDHTSLPDWYRNADLVVNPSLSESFGMTLAEAMACGTPVVAALAGGMPEVVGDAGELVPPDDPQALADALGALLGDGPRRAQMTTAARQRALQHFSWERVAQQTMACYMSMLKGADACG